MSQQQRSRRRQERAWTSPTNIATAAIVAYGAYRIVAWAWNMYSKTDDEEDEEAFRQARRSRGSGLDMDRNNRLGGLASPATNTQTTLPNQRFHMRRDRIDRCRDEVRTALKGFLPALQRIIDERTDTSEQRQALKNLRAAARAVLVDTDVDAEAAKRKKEEEALWEIVKVKSFTRMFATAYAHSILLLVLSVQVNLLGGKLLQEQMSEDEVVSSRRSVGSQNSTASERLASYQASHRRVLLHTYDYFFQEGIPALIHSLERSVSESMTDWNVLDSASLRFSSKDMDDVVAAVRKRMETSYRNMRRSVLRFLVPPSAHVPELETLQDDLAASILDETWDLIESPVFEDAEDDCLNTTFTIMRDQHLSRLFREDLNVALENPILGQEILAGEDPSYTKPLAQIISKIKRVTNSFYPDASAGNSENEQASTSAISSNDNETNKYCRVIQLLPSVLEICDVSFN